MQVAVMLIFLAVWLLILWIGSIAFESTGLPRSKARFQALSALTGTGFTTSEAESVVNYPRRRRIATWLIFIGNAGIIAFIILMILYVRSGLAAPSVRQIIILVAVILGLFLLVILRAIDRLTDGIIKVVRRGRPITRMQTEELLHQAGDYAVARVSIREDASTESLKLGDTAATRQGVMVLAIERANKVLAFPDSSEVVLPGDHLLCYGKTVEIANISR